MSSISVVTELCNKVNTASQEYARGEITHEELVKRIELAKQVFAEKLFGAIKLY